MIAAGSQRGRLSGRWLVTFADLSAVMVAFFVLMFSMSEVDVERWDGAVEALNRRFDLTAEDVPAARPQAESNILSVETVPGTNLSYLSVLLARQFASQEVLAPARLTLFEDQLVISLAGDDLFDGAGRLTREGRGLLFVLSGMLASVNNGFDVVVHRQRGDDSRWAGGIQRAEIVAQALREAGYRQPIRRIGYGDRQDPILPRRARLAVAGRVDIVVAETQEVR